MLPKPISKWMRLQAKQILHTTDDASTLNLDVDVH